MILRIFGATHDAKMSDSEDEIGDWTAISQLENQQASVLKRGDKDFAPDGTQGQQSQLARSRNAMYSALGRPYAHSQKTLIRGDWDEESGRCRVDKPLGTFFTKMGKVDRGIMWLNPEETAYLAQRGSMQCFWQGELMSIQAVCTACFRRVSPAHISVYSYLRKLGYVVFRTSQYPQFASADSSKYPKASGHLSLISFLTARWHTKFAWRPYYSSFNGVFRDLRLVTTGQSIRNQEASPVDYFVWKPSTRLKKSDPPQPDYYVKVIDTRLSKLPTISQARGLLANAPVSPGQQRSKVGRMKHGFRTVTLAVVDSGVVSFVHVKESALDRSLFP